MTDARLDLARNHPDGPHRRVSAALVLAAGPSLIRLGGLTILERAVRVLRAAGLERVIVASGPETPTATLVRHRDLPAELSDASAPPVLTGRCLLVSGDQVFDTDTVTGLVGAPHEAALAAGGPAGSGARGGGLAVVDAGTATALLSPAEPSTGPGWPAALAELADHPGIAWHEPDGFLATVSDRGDVRRAERALWRRYGPKPTDGLVAHYLNRPLSRPATLWLLRSRLSPDALTVLSFLLVLAGAAVTGFGGRWWLAICGGILIALGNALDGVDGEVARVSLRTSRRGALLDTILDRYADLAVLAGLALAAGAGPAAWTWAFAAGAAAMLIPYINALVPTAPQRLLRRDVRLLACALAAAVSLPLWGLILVAVVGNVDAARVFWLVIRRAPGAR
jgi:1L-myo-inositol 1-phosphate cytidylyltransferase / CDP-L-myo-inositol myo-inositolphosphotransferase